jgi:hypothetical protein
MALSIEQKRALLQRDLPHGNEVRNTLNEYLQRTSLHPQDFAKRIGYSYMAVRTFLANAYEKISGSERPICAAILDFIHVHPIAPLSHSEGRLHETENVKLIRKYFYEALDRRCAYYFRGAPGCQKSFVLEHLVAELNCAELCKNGHGRRAFYVYCRQGIRPVDLLKRVAESAGSITAGSADRIIRNLRFDFGARKVLIAFDEAQHLDVACLETVRELLDRPPHCGLLFAGSHELEKTFQRLDMEQWASRLRQGAELPGIALEEALGIVRTELPGTSESNASKLIESCYSRDLRKGREVKYISARTLFWSIQKIQERQAQKAKAVSA